MAWLPETSTVLRWWKDIWTYFKNWTLLESPALSETLLQSSEASQQVSTSWRTPVKGFFFFFSARGYALYYLKKKGGVYVSGLLLWGRRILLLFWSYFYLTIYKYTLLKLESIVSPVFSHCMWHSVVVHYKNDRPANYWPHC